jgi:glyceraldehyde 3-phosphate dehydrogenase
MRQCSCGPATNFSPSNRTRCFCGIDLRGHAPIIEDSMTIRIAINGYGRIGRNVLRAHYEGRKHDLEIVAINDLGAAESCAHLTRYDTVHGRFPKYVELHGDVMIVDGDYIKVLSQPDIARLPWAALGIDVVLECTGRFTSKASASGHLRGGAKKVVISALGATDVDATVVYGINHHELKPWHTVISNASCTTNCLAPLVLPLHCEIGIVSGIVTSIHGYTSDQALIDSCDEDLRRARSATMNIIPTTTGAAAAVGRVLPELNGRLEGCGIRVPTINVAILDLTFVAARDTTVEEVNAVMQEAGAVGPLAGVLRYSNAPLVSTDFNHDPASATFDATLTKVAGRQVKVSAWYDNEWGYANRLLDTTLALMNARRSVAQRYAAKGTMIDPNTVCRPLETA